jgi:hypothetical protein
MTIEKFKEIYLSLKPKCEWHVFKLQRALGEENGVRFYVERCRCGLERACKQSKTRLWQERI